MAVKRKKRKILLILVGVVIALFIDSNTRIVCDKYEIESSSLPEAFDGFRIVQLSDLHGKVFGKDNEKLLRKIAAQKPDIIAVTGDMVDKAGMVSYAEDLVSRLCEIAPVYYVTGNHEWAIKEARDVVAAVERAGGTPLRNKYATVERGGDTIVIAGIDDPNGPYDMMTPQELSDKVDKNAPDTFSVLLAHRNDPFTYLGLTFDAVLCGHAHGGVIRLPVIGGLLGTNHKLFPDFTDGTFSLGSGTLFVSRGLGNANAIPRFLNNPQIAVLELKRK